MAGQRVVYLAEPMGERMAASKVGRSVVKRAASRVDN